MLLSLPWFCTFLSLLEIKFCRDFSPICTIVTHVPSFREQNFVKTYTFIVNLLPCILHAELCIKLPNEGKISLQFVFGGIMIRIESLIDIYSQCYSCWKHACPMKVELCICQEFHIKSGTDEGNWAETSAVYINQQHLHGFYTKENHRGNARFDHRIRYQQT